MTTWTNLDRTGQGWAYDQEGITYDGDTDDNTGNTVYYNSLGLSMAWTNELKP